MWKCNRCGASTPKTCTCPKAGDATPPATPQPETPDKWQFVADVMMDRRDLLPGDECDRCGGWGIVTYGNTSTWRKGIGGSAMTADVCDACWGSGNKNRPWPSRAALSPPPDVERLTRERDRLAARVVELEERLHQFHEEARTLAVRICNSTLTPERLRQLLSPSTPGEPT